MKTLIMIPTRPKNTPHLYQWIPGMDYMIGRLLEPTYSRNGYCTYHGWALEPHWYIEIPWCRND